MMQVEIKKCVDDNIIPYIPEPDPGISKRINVPEPPFYKREFRYDKEMCTSARQVLSYHSETWLRFMES